MILVSRRTMASAKDILTTSETLFSVYNARDLCDMYILAFFNHSCNNIKIQISIAAMLITVYLLPALLP